MQNIRNVAIIAHVDHGKTTLVDRMIYQANLVRQPENLGQLILDNNDLERERGITIKARAVRLNYKDENGEPLYHELSGGEIFGRTMTVVCADMIISTLFRASNDQGFSSRVYVDTSAVEKNLENASEKTINRLKNYITHMRTWANIDSALDIFENISTDSGLTFSRNIFGTQRSMSRPRLAASFGHSSE